MNKKFLSLILKPMSMLASKRDSHNLSSFAHFAPDTPAPDTDDPVFGIIKQVMGF